MAKNAATSEGDDEVGAGGESKANPMEPKSQHEDVDYDDIFKL